MYCSYPTSFFQVLVVITLLLCVSCSNPEKGEDGALVSIPEDYTQQLDSLSEKARNLAYSNIDSAIILAKGAYNFCQEKNLSQKSAEFLALIGSFYRVGGLNSVAETYLNQGLEVSQQFNDKIWIAAIREQKGYNFLEWKNYSKALENMRSSLQLWQELDSIPKIIELRKDLCVYFTQRKMPREAWEEYQEAENLLRKHPDGEQAWYLAFAKGDLLLLEKRYQEAIQTYLDQNSIETYPNIGFIYKEWGDSIELNHPKEAKDHFREGETFHQKSFEEHYRKGFTSRVILDYYNLGGIKRRLDKYEAAIDTLEKGIMLAHKNGSSKWEADMYRVLSETYTDMNDDSLALVNYITFKEITDSITSARNAKITRLAEVHYETDKTEQEKIQAEQENELRELQLGISLLIVGLVTLVALLYFLRYQSRKKLMKKQAELNRQVVVDLIKEHTIENLNSRIEGQEQEKERIARELHDQLGGTLAAVKFSLEGMERELPVSLKTRFEKTHELLQTATEETRNLSHEMRGLPLQNLGLDESLKSLGDTLNNSKRLSVHVNSTSISASNISQKAQFHLYRICQELLQNVIKHAKASEVFMQLTYEAEKMTLMVEDNGKGFDTSVAKNGLGLQNIRDRVAQINGKLDFDSTLGQGTTVIIEVPTEPI